MAIRIRLQNWPYPPKYNEKQRVEDYLRSLSEWMNRQYVALAENSSAMKTDLGSMVSVAYGIPSGNNETIDLTAAGSCYGQIYTNTGNDSDTHYDLPAAVVGMNATFFNTVAQTITLDPNLTDRIAVLTGTNGDYLRSDGVIGSYIRLVCLAANTWHCADKTGTWTEE